jgi:hypothetical protein
VKRATVRVLRAANEVFTFFGLATFDSEKASSPEARPGKQVTAMRVDQASHGIVRAVCGVHALARRGAHTATRGHGVYDCWWY